MKSIFEIYCSIVCFFSLIILVYAMGQILINMYYYFSPEAALPPSMTLESQHLRKFKLPPGCEYLEETPEEILARKQSYYNFHIETAVYSAARHIKLYIVYFVLLLLVFIGHLKLAIYLNAKTT